MIIRSQEVLINNFWHADAKNAFIADLRESKDYISKTLHNPKAAQRVTKSIMNYCSNLKTHPQLEMSLAAKTGEETELPYLVCEQHLAMYRLEGDLILIARILDGGTDYMRALFK